MAPDEGAGLVRGAEPTTANIHDAAELAAVLPDARGDGYGDSAFAERMLAELQQNENQ